MDSIVEQVTQLVGKLPGIGPKTADRLTHYLLQAPKHEVFALSDALKALKEQVRNCKQCFNLTEQELCAICSDARRDPSLICIVEQPRDLQSIEKTGSFQGVYHVLLGRISPLEGITPDRLTIKPLMDRVRQGNVEEIIMATNPTIEGDGTALFLSNLLADFPVKVTRLARGIASGSVLEFANNQMLADAISHRNNF